jgi:serine/threonine protein kinase
MDGNETGPLKAYIYVRTGNQRSRLEVPALHDRDGIEVALVLSCHWRITHPEKFVRALGYESTPPDDPVRKSDVEETLISHIRRPVVDNTGQYSLEDLVYKESIPREWWQKQLTEVLGPLGVSIVLKKPTWRTEGQAGEYDPRDILPGTRIPPKYRVFRQIGKGGMGVVYYAVDERLDRPVALKFLCGDGATVNERTSKLWRREVKNLAKIAHPNVVAIHDASDAYGFPFIEMEYVDGDNASKIVEANGPFPVEQALHIARQALAGLAAGWEAGVIHCDVKPHNILVTKDHTAKIADFGLGWRFRSTHNEAETRLIGGTYRYCAPEVLHGREPDCRADIYSLGVTIYEMLTGRAPFTAPNGDANTVNLTELAWTEREIREIPADLVRLIGVMASPDPGKRPADAETIQRCLETIRQRLPVQPIKGVAVASPLGRILRVDPSPVTWREFLSFINSGAYDKTKDVLKAKLRKRIWTPAGFEWLASLSTRKPIVPENVQDFPERYGHEAVSGICWYEAAAFCNWRTLEAFGDAPSCLSASLAYEVECEVDVDGGWRLPTEQELRRHLNGVEPTGSQNLWEWVTDNYIRETDKAYMDPVRMHYQSYRQKVLVNPNSSHGSMPFEPGERRYNATFRCAIRSAE